MRTRPGGFYPSPGMSGHDGMEAAKSQRDDELQAAYHRSLPARKVDVERTLTGRSPDWVNLATVINLLAINGTDTPELRLGIEVAMRRGVTITTAHGTYRCAPAHTFPDWSPEMVKDTH